MKTALKNSNHGFTLIEIVIAISILAVILSVTYSALTQIIRSKNVLDDRRDLNIMAHSVIQRVSKELQHAYSGIGLLPRPNESNDKSLPSNINLIGETKQLANRKRGDSIRFIALEAGQYLPDGGTHSGLVQIMYRVEEDPENKNLDPPRYVLVREETPVIRPNEKAFAKMMIFPITEDLVSLSIRYYDGEELEWANNWGKEKRVKLPVQVELTMELASPRGEIHKFVTAVPLRNIN